MRFVNIRYEATLKRSDVLLHSLFLRAFDMDFKMVLCNSASELCFKYQHVTKYHIIEIASWRIVTERNAPVWGKTYPYGAALRQYLP